MSDPFATLLSEPLDDDEYVWAQWAGTMHLSTRARELDAIAKDRRRSLTIRRNAALAAEAIRTEMHP
jgi:hypothetical protein